MGVGGSLDFRADGAGEREVRQCVLPAERDCVLLEPAEAEIDRVWLPVLLQHSDRALHR